MARAGDRRRLQQSGCAEPTAGRWGVVNEILPRRRSWTSTSIERSTWMRPFRATSSSHHRGSRAWLRSPFSSTPRRPSVRAATPSTISIMRGLRGRDGRYLGHRRHAPHPGVRSGHRARVREPRRLRGAGRSPAIDMGSSALYPRLDFQLTPRPQGMAVDLGAFEATP